MCITASSNSSIIHIDSVYILVEDCVALRVREGGPDPGRKMISVPRIKPVHESFVDDISGSDICHHVAYQCSMYSGLNIHSDIREDDVLPGCMSSST